ncbi:DNA polymerase III subunit alpha [Glycocaulis sp.]|uniref:DNA polymerase III subunit alpha n=1 Tax=Glycocaulis sp. TaxID=1969725 RepID=UPI0025C1F158|nr:DNA polymerase III subunit alpha [Glycocaulis sp.]MCH8521366.1 DNA polymerase III subunit alpha [Glycocaulis sp.]
MMEQGGFVHLRARSPYSLLEGAMRIGEIASLCKTHAMPAVALTDTNNLFGALEFSEYISSVGVQPIIGCTLSVKLEAERPAERVLPAGTLVLLVQDEAGYRNLMALSSSAFLDVEPSEEPSVTLDAVLARHEGLICLTGGLDGVLNRLVCADKAPRAAEVLDRLAAVFGDRLYIELQRHGRAEELKAEDWLVGEAYQRGLPLVATNEPFFGTPDRHEAHDALMCIAQSSYLIVDDRRKVTPDHDFKSGAAMAEIFADLPEAIDNTVDIARRCAYRPVQGDPILPRFPGLEGRSEEEELVFRAREGLAARLEQVEPVAPASEYEERLAFELSVIERMGFPGYFLIVADFIQWAKAQGIPVGPGRGSGAGSVVAWALTITDLDPLRFGLLFERFLNPERVSMPDFDIDFCQERRGEVIRYVQERYGADRVAQIITFGTLQARAVLRDVGRVLQIPFPVVDRIAKLVPNNPAQPVTLAEAMETEPKLQAMRREDSAVDRLVTVALQLEGLYRNASTHAAGVVIGDRPLPELVPLYRDPRSDIPATQFNMKWVEPAGLVKFDFLGLKTLTVMARALSYIEASTGETIDLDAVPLDDRKAYELMASGDTIGVFQLESSGMRDTLKKVKPDTFEDIIALISLYRPGPMKNIDTYVERKFGRSDPDYLHPDLEPVLKETHGVIIYQEQVMQIAQILSGYSLGEADLLRRAMGKKKKEEMDQQRVRFLQGAKERGVAEAKASYIFDLVAEFAGYGFNKSHAAAYALIAYRTAWLKAHHPVAFMAALMSLDAGNTDKLAVFFQEARRMGVPVLGPDINRSEADFSVEEGAVRYGLGAIRSAGFAAMEELVKARASDGPFRDLYDFAGRIDPRSVNKRLIETLARAGAFDSVEPDRARVLAAAETLCAIAQSAHAERESAQVSLFGGEGSSSGGLARPALPSAEPWEGTRRLDEELSAIGFYLSGHPLDAYGEVLARRGVVSWSDLLDRVRDESVKAVRLAGIVRRRQEKLSKRNNERFAFLTLSDASGEFEALVPPKVLAQTRDMLEPGEGIVATMRVEENEDQVRLILDGCEPLSGLLKEAALPGLTLLIEDPGALEGIRERLGRAGSAAGSNGGRGVIVLDMALDDGSRARVRLPGGHTIDPSLRSALKQVAGVAAVEALSA